jgi:hypothetical protein
MQRISTTHLNIMQLISTHHTTSPPIIHLFDASLLSYSPEHEKIGAIRKALLQLPEHLQNKCHLSFSYPAFCFAFVFASCAAQLIVLIERPGPSPT